MSSQSASYACRQLRPVPNVATTYSVLTQIKVKTQLHQRRDGQKSFHSLRIRLVFRKQLGQNGHERLRLLVFLIVIVLAVSSDP